jgi:hypothetical protein
MSKDKPKSTNQKAQTKKHKPKSNKNNKKGANSPFLT